VRLNRSAKQSYHANAPPLTGVIHGQRREKSNFQDGVRELLPEPKHKEGGENPVVRP